MAQPGASEQDLLHYLQSIVKLVLGEELDTIRSSISSLESKFTRIIDDLKDDTNNRFDTTIEESINDARNRINDLKSAQERATRELDDKLQQAITEMRTRFSDFDEKIHDTLEKTYNKEISRFQEEVRNSLSEIEHQISKHAQSLDSTRQESERVTTFFKSFASLVGNKSNQETGSGGAPADQQSDAAFSRPEATPGAEDREPVREKLVNPDVAPPPPQLPDSKKGKKLVMKGNEFEWEEEEEAKPKRNKKKKSKSAAADPGDTSEDLPQSDDVEKSIDSLFHLND